MKVLIVLVAVAFVCVNGLTEALNKKVEENKLKAIEHIKFCKKDGDVDEELSKKLTFGDFTDRSKKAQCFVKCFFQQSGFMDKDGVPQKDVIIDKLLNKAGVKQENLSEIVGKCVQEKGEESCETAYKIYECYWTNGILTPKTA